MTHPTDPFPPAPEQPLADVSRRLRLLQPAEPDPAARERVWRQVSRQVDESVPAVVASRLKTLSPPDPSQAVSDRVWGRLQAQIRDEKREKRPGLMPIFPSNRGPAARRLHPALGLATLALLVALTTINSVAQAALPGTALYPVKRGWEAVQLSLTLLPSSRAQLALTLADRRLAEAASLIAQGRDPALVAQALASARDHLAYAAAHLPPEALAAHLAAYQSAAAQVDEWLATLPTPVPGTGVVPSVTPSPTVAATPTPLLALTPDPTVPGLAVTLPPSLVPPSLVPPSVLPPSQTPITATPTPTLPGANPTATPSIPLPTLPLPTLPLPTLSLPLPTLALPTLPIPTLQLPTVVLPTLQLPTLPFGLPLLNPPPTSTPTPPP